MRTLHFLLAKTSLLLAGCSSSCSSESEKINIRADRPNVLIILSDDQGYADVGYHGFLKKEVRTPSIDQLAEDGVIFSQGYASASVCAPTRAGLLTGRYQQRFGFYKAVDSRQGLPLSEISIAEILRSEGYATGVFGKWHLGINPEYHPLRRGFDEFYGFLGHGAHDYFDLSCNPYELHNCIYRNEEIINDTGYLTDNLAREAVKFIDKNVEKNKKFFLYLPFNAVHWPLQAPAEDIITFTGNEDRDTYLAMLYRMDQAIGEVINSLKRNGIYENTLIFFLSDNGGAIRVNANNFPLRGYKHSSYEGGIRVPFIMTWRAAISQNIICDEPIMSFDLFPTICAAVGAKIPDDLELDGKDIFQILLDPGNFPLHQNLFWDQDDGNWAVRKQEWKLVKNSLGNLELYNLSKDICEIVNHADKHPDIVKKMMSKYTLWRESMGEPMTQ